MARKEPALQVPTAVEQHLQRVVTATHAGRDTTALREPFSPLLAQQESITPAQAAQVMLAALIAMVAMSARS